MRRIIVALLALVNAACATSTYLPLNPPNPKQAQIYMIREYAEPAAWNFWVDVDGKRAASLSNGSFAAFSVDLGVHRLSFEWPLFASYIPKAERDVNFSQSTTYYFLVEGNASVLRILSIPETKAKMLLKKMQAED